MAAVDLSGTQLVTQELCMSNVDVALIVAVVLLALYVAAALTATRDSGRLPWQLRMAQLRRSAYVPRQNNGEP
jgi:hypothetical protein